MFVPLVSAPSSFKDCLCVIPAVSVGNVGQLCVDVLLSNVGAVKIGFLHDQNVLPYAGNDTASDTITGKISVSLEVFYVPSKQVVIVQQRSPCISGRKISFTKNLCDWIEKSDFKQVILLTSTEASKRDDTDLAAGSPFSYFLTHPAEATEKALVTLGWKTTGVETSPETLSSNGVDKKEVPVSSDELPASVLPSPRKSKGQVKSNAPQDLPSPKKPRPKIKGGGITRPMFNRCRTQGIELLGISVFSTDGSNTQEGISCH